MNFPSRIFFQLKNEMKLRFQEIISDTKDLDFRKGSTVGKLGRQNVIKLSNKKFLQSQNEVKLSRKILDTKDQKL